MQSVSVANYGGNTLLLAVGAAVIGGTSLFGGKGRIVDAIIGGAVVEVIYNGMSNLVTGQNSASVQYIVTGLVLLLAAAVDALSRRRAGATRAVIRRSDDRQSSDHVMARQPGGPTRHDPTPQPASAVGRAPPQRPAFAGRADRQSRAQPQHDRDAGLRPTYNGLVIEHAPGTRASGAGRPSHVVGPRPDGPYALAVDIDVHHLTVAAVAIGGNVLARRAVELPGDPDPG